MAQGRSLGGARLVEPLHDCNRERAPDTPCGKLAGGCGRSTASFENHVMVFERFHRVGSRRGTGFERGRTVCASFRSLSREKALVLPAKVPEKIEAIVRLPIAEQRVAKTGQAVVRMAAAVGTSNIAMLVGVNERTVRKCKKRFHGESPVDKLADDPRSERPPSVCRVPMQHGTLTLMTALDVRQCMFGIIQRRVLRRGSFRCADELINKMYDHMIWHNQSSQPLGWSYRPRSWSASQSGAPGGPS